MLANSWTSSRFGVTVNEDLGGGMSSQAVWESNIGTTEAAAATGSLRQAFVGLKSNTMGTIQAGAVYMPEYGQGITVAGTVNSYGQGGTVLNQDSTAVKTSTAVHRMGTIDQSNMINYIAPKMGAVTLSAQVGTAGAQKTGASGGANTTDTKGDLMGLSANYAQGPLNATASYSTLNKSTMAVSAAASKCAPTSGANATAITCVAADIAAGNVYVLAPTVAAAATDTKQKNTTLSATYALGAANLYGYYANREMSGTTVLKYTTTNVGVNYTMGALTPFVSMSSGSLKDSAGAETSKPSATQIGVNYAFSKRTNAYLYQASYKDDKALTTTSYKASQTAFGVAHAF
jgi:predicted porin